MNKRINVLFVSMLFVQPGWCLADTMQVTTLDETVQQDIQATSSYNPEEELADSESKGGYLHPTFALKSGYTENLYNTENNRESSFVTTLSPGIWYRYPRAKQQPINIASHNTSTSGVQLEIPDEMTFHKYQVYLSGGLDYRIYTEDSDLNKTDVKLEGMFQYNLRSGLSFQIVDQYIRNQDMFDISSFYPEGIHRFSSNLINGIVDWDFSEKFAVKVDYSEFLLDYSDSELDYLDRVDSKVGIWARYKYSLKTAFFVQYSHAWVEYDNPYSYFSTGNEQKWDNEQNYFYFGIDWASSEKTSVLAKVGYQDREFDDTFTEDLATESGDLTFEVQFNHRFSPKSGLNFSVYRAIEASDSSEALGKEVVGIEATYSQVFTERLSGNVLGNYEYADYDQFLGEERIDKRYRLRPAINYDIRKWISVGLYYEWEWRTSTNETYDYDSNRLMFSANISL